MTESTLAGVITAIGACLTALALIVGAVPALVKVLRRTEAVEKQAAEIHTIVNQQRTDAQRYQAALVDALRKAGIDVPADQSLSAAPTSE